MSTQSSQSRICARPELYSAAEAADMPVPAPKAELSPRPNVARMDCSKDFATGNCAPPSIEPTVAMICSRTMDLTWTGISS
ncbi:Uncharacterised protein [Bordetella pertussis]|nr:Uncharacterised protein [Bordetella pertussis]